MSDAERTEKPTARKLRRARERGEVAQSPLATGSLVLLGVTATVALGAGGAVTAWSELVRSLWAAPAPGPLDALGRAADAAAPFLAAPLAVAVGLGALGSFLQVGPLSSAKPLAPDATRLDPGRGLARLFSGRRLAERLGGLPLALGVAAVGLATLAQALPGLVARTDLGAARLASAGAGVVVAFLARAGALLAVASVVAVAHRRWRWWREQHMTRRERRAEQRETEGEPLARRRRARVQRERAMGPSVDEALARASLVVVGPDRGAVLEWADRDAAPRLVLVARGAALAHVRAGRAPAVSDAALAARLAAAPRGPVDRRLWPALARHFARLEGRGA
jgi:flagellar biosynthesis protein FlhB